MLNYKYSYGEKNSHLYIHSFQTSAITDFETDNKVLLHVAFFEYVLRYRTKKIKPKLLEKSSSLGFFGYQSNALVLQL